jgi:S-adenosylmethionine:tRNA ribosyltransferase-isomerase
VKRAVSMRDPVEADDLRPATEPPEARGLLRDEVRLLIARADGTTHTTFRELARFLWPGDLLVFNTSATISAAIDGTRDDQPVLVHVSAALDDGSFVVELRLPDNSGPLLDGATGDRVVLPGWGTLEIASAYAGVEGRSRLVSVTTNGPGSFEEHLSVAGRPIKYPYLVGDWPLESYQTVFSKTPGSAEMPSAGRPFTAELVTELVAAGVGFAPVLLHSGVASLDKGERPLEERFSVPYMTARRVNEHRRAGGRIVAVGTTAARALETAAQDDGIVRPDWGWTDLVLSSDRPARVVDGLITGWHPPEASHHDLLISVAGMELVEDAYREAAWNGYLSHEFGDSCLLLP